jgi:spore germination protein
MKVFEYGDEEIDSKEIMLGTASMVIGLGILTLPRLVADVTESSDGWMSILIAGMLAIFLAWVAAKLASRFPNMTFITYTGLIATKPVAIILTCLMFAYFFFFSAYVTRGIAIISKQYLFDETPVEVIALIFILIITYAVAGSRVGLLRLNLLFFPIVLVFLVLLLSFSTGLVELNNLKPFFVTNWTGIYQGAKESIFSLLGFEIILFYISYMNRPKEAPKAAVIGVAIPIVLYVFIYLIVISVFAVEPTRQVMFPTIELAKEIELPGQFFERLESLFFVIWIMTIFNTGSMAFDICIMAVSSIFKNVKKMTWLWVLSPLVYIMAMMPQDLIEYYNFGKYVSYLGLVIVGVIPSLLLIIAKIRGVRGHS